MKNIQQKNKIKKALALLLAVVLMVSILSGCFGNTFKGQKPASKEPPIEEPFEPDDEPDKPKEEEKTNRYAFLQEVEWQEGDLIVHFLDVGHGDAIFIQFPDATTMLIDGGSGDLFYNPATYIRDYIRAITASKSIDYIFLTHPHIDHCNALANIISWFNVSYFYTPDILPMQVDTKSFTKYYDAMVGKQGATIVNNIGIQQVNDIFTIYGASAEMYQNIGFATSSKSQLNYEINTISPIAVLEYADRRIVFTGDATFTTEEYFISLLPPMELLKTDILKVAHHGREESTGEEFLGFLQPDFAIISAGGLVKPKTSVLNRLGNVVGKENIFRTDMYGAFVIKIAPDADIEFYWENQKTA